MSSIPLVRKNVGLVKPYIAGKPIEETKRELGLRSVIKLASNENPLGVSPKALKAMKGIISGVNRYPDSQSFYLKHDLARRYKLAPENFVLGNGSDELIDVVIKTFVEDDENIVTADVTFLEYSIIASVNNVQVFTAPLENFKFNLEGILKLVNQKTKLIFIANPNNPTGTYVNKDELNALLHALPEHVIVVLDEAYDTFIDVDDYPNSIDLINAGKNVIALKTFSKAYGLAGLRIGTSIASKTLSGYMERVRQPFNVNLVAQEAARAALTDNKFLQKSRILNLTGKKFLYSQLDKMKISYVPSVANFILIDCKRDGVEIFKKMLKNGVIVRDMKQYNLNTFIRVTIGTEKENKRFIQAFEQALK